jgi:hypothetical protein
LLVRHTSARCGCTTARRLTGKSLWWRTVTACPTILRREPYPCHCRFLPPRPPPSHAHSRFCQKTHAADLLMAWGLWASHASPGEKQRDDLGSLLAEGNFAVEPTNGWRPGRVRITGCSGSCSADTTAEWERSLLCLPHVRKMKEDRWMCNEEWR